MLLRIIERFGFTVLAEGIETEEQLSWLLAHGCARGQGYLLAHPRPFSELLERFGKPPARTTRHLSIASATNAVHAR
jgi:EAL domain-containing protein (putative c-di-GMP-specific phosphodiesterase class I)